MKISIGQTGLALVPESPEECGKLKSLFDTYMSQNEAITFGAVSQDDGRVEGIFVTVGCESIKNVFGLMNTKAADEFQIRTRGDHSQN